MNRRHFHQSLLAAGGLWAGSAVSPLVAPAHASTPAVPSGKAESCIFLWLGGGMCHVDTFDPKQLGDPAARKAGSAYPAIDTAIAGAQVCQFLPRVANLLDRGAILRSVNHPIPGEHAAPTNLFKTGRFISDTIVYPSMGSIVAHERGPREPGIPAYVVMGYPNVTRGPGFLGSRYSYIYLTDTEAGPSGLRRPVDVDELRHERRTELLSLLRERYLARVDDDQVVSEYDGMITEAFRLSGQKFTRVFDLAEEPDAVRNRYGDEFGQRCLLARRLVQAGVRFIDVSFNLNFLNGTGWDTHRHGQLEQHRLIESLDVSLSALLEDLERHRLLDDTLVVLATEFGRPPEFDGGGGRGHQSTAFSTVFFGGGLRTGQVIGQTDELGKRVVDFPISLPDWHATVHNALGIDPSKELYAGDRPVPITDHGHPVPQLFS